MAQFFEIDSNDDIEPSLVTSGTGLFELDTQGNLMPTLVLYSDDYFEWDENDDIMPGVTSVLVLLTAYCFNTKNQTWTVFDNFPNGIPIVLKHLGVGLHIEDNNIYKIFEGYNDDGSPMTIKVTTGRHTTPDTQYYKSVDCAEIYTDGDSGIDYSYPTKSQLIFDGVTDSTTTMVSPGGYSPLQKIKTAFSQCKNYALRLIATVAGSNTVSHAIQSIKWKVNVRGLIK